MNSDPPSICREQLALQAVAQDYQRTTMSLVMGQMALISSNWTSGRGQTLMESARMSWLVRDAFMQ